MSYKNKITNYQGDCIVLLGRCPKFSDYIKEFANKHKGDGLDVGAGPGGCNSAYLEHCKSLDGCDAEPDVVKSLDKAVYGKSFMYVLGSNDKLPYLDGVKDFVICSCMIQHLNSLKELDVAMNEMSRILKQDGELFLMFKAGTNDTNLTHFNGYYGEERTFRVFEPRFVMDIGGKHGLKVGSNELLMDENWIPYCCLTFRKA